MTSTRPGSDRIAITGMGVVTSLGLTAASTLAAIRSGIANFSHHETVVVYDDAHGTELTGARVARLPKQIVSPDVPEMDRVVALLAPAVTDCIRGISPNLLQQATWRIGNRSITENGSHLLGVVSEVCGFPISAARLTEEKDPSVGRCLFSEDIIQAAATLSRTAPLAFVGCIDSLCDSTILQELAEVDSLKSGMNPEGIVAGEAAGIFVLELESHARHRGADILAFLRAWGRGTEPHPWLKGWPSTAMGLREALGEVVAALPGNGEEIDVVIADLNGERTRSDEWAMTATAVLPIQKKVPDLMHPADCTGDCGSAMGAVLLATALDVLSRSTTPQTTVALCTSDDAGARRVLLLEKGDDVNLCEVPRHDRPSTTVVSAVIDQHQDDASFLWIKRQRLMKKANVDRHDLDQLDARIEANLCGLCSAGEAAWNLATGALARGDAGDWFTAAFLAFWEDDYERIEYLLQRSDCDFTRCKAMASALGWLRVDKAAPFIERLLSAESPHHRYIGVAASAMHRHDPGHLLTDAVFAPSPFLQARALRAYGELGRRGHIHLSTLEGHFSAEDDAVSFAASWSAALAGSPEALEVLTAFIHTKSPFSEEALNVALRIIKKEAALPLLHDLAQSPDSLRLAVVSAGIIGETAVMPWLVEQMSNIHIARIASEAFRMLTGIDIAVAELVGTPEDLWAGPGDDMKERGGSVDRDEGLPWPDPKLVGAWWEKNKGGYKAGTRHLLGKPITYDHIHHTIETGRQGDRAAAALELAIMNPGQPLYNICAPRHLRG